MYRDLHAVSVAIVDRGHVILARATTPDAGDGDEAAIAEALRSADERIADLQAADVEGPAGSRVAMHPFAHEGQHLATVVVGPYAPDAIAGAEIAAHLVGMFGILTHHAHARHLTSTMHSEAMEHNYAELTAKNERLEQAVEHMQEVDRVKSSFLATVSHELRTPLTSVIGYAEMLFEGLAGPLNKEQRDYLQTILSKADQLLQLITALLETSILESGPVPIQHEPLDMNQIIERVLSSLGPQARARTIEVRPIPADLPRILGDARRMRQVLRALIANAVKFTTERARIDIDVRVAPLSRYADEGDTPGVRVVVADAGIGIPLEDQESIFEPFFQVDSSSTRRYGGTGLGLTLAKSYIEANGGHIWVESAPGEGASFTFTVPAEPDELARYLARERDA